MTAFSSILVSNYSQENPFRRAQRRAQSQTRRDHRPLTHDSDTSSTGSSDESQGQSPSHQSLPVLAEVHGFSLGQSSTEVPPGSRAPFPSLQTRPSVFNSHPSLNDGDGIVVNILPTGPSNPINESLSHVQSIDTDDVKFEGASHAIEIAEPENPSALGDNVSSSSSTASNSNRNAIV